MSTYIIGQESDRKFMMQNEDRCQIFILLLVFQWVSQTPKQPLVPTIILTGWLLELSLSTTRMNANSMVEC
jgi:hypothetical protein